MGTLVLSLYSPSGAREYIFLCLSTAHNMTVVKNYLSVLQSYEHEHWKCQFCCFMVLHAEALDIKPATGAGFQGRRILMVFFAH